MNRYSYTACLTFLILVINGNPLSGQVMNGTFDDWTEAELLEYPEGWLSPTLGFSLMLEEPVIIQSELPDNETGVTLRTIEGDQAMMGTDSLPGVLVNDTVSYPNGFPIDSMPDVISLNTAYEIYGHFPGTLDLSFKYGDSTTYSHTIQVSGDSSTLHDMHDTLVFDSIKPVADHVEIEIICGSKPGDEWLINTLTMTANGTEVFFEDFEEWFALNIEIPNFWTTSESLSMMEGKSTATKSEHSSIGNYSLRLESKFLEMMGTPFAYGGSFVSIEDTTFPDKLHFDYDYTPNGFDFSMIYVARATFNEETEEIEQTGDQMELLESTNGFETFTLNLIEPAEEEGEIAGLIVTFIPTVQERTGNVMYIDNVRLEWEKSNNDDPNFIAEDPYIKDHNSVSLYPNPAGNSLNITGLPQSPDNITILNSTGRKVTASTYCNQADCSMDIEHLAEGVYHLKIESGDEVFMKRFLKKD